METQIAVQNSKLLENHNERAYMELLSSGPLQRSGTLKVRLVQTYEELEVYSEVQGRGFLETEQGFREWYPWLRAANRRNLEDPNQRFYVGSLGGEPAGVALMVIHDGMAGIYSVATIPRFRKSGVSTGLLATVMADARSAGCATITLQVNCGTYAESFYLKRGFRSVFELEVFTAPSSS